jgi:hypothetical protein
VDVHATQVRNIYNIPQDICVLANDYAKIPSSWTNGMVIQMGPLHNWSAQLVIQMGPTLELDATTCMLSWDDFCTTPSP